MTYMKEIGDLLKVAGQDVLVSCINNDYWLKLKIKIMEEKKRNLIIKFIDSCTFMIFVLLEKE